MIFLKSLGINLIYGLNQLKKITGEFISISRSMPKRKTHTKKSVFPVALGKFIFIFFHLKAKTFSFYRKDLFIFLLFISLLFLAYA
jgi:hypothetical protein